MQFAWTEEWQRLALEERTLTAGLEKWMQDNAAVLIDVACEDEDDAGDTAGAPASSTDGPAFLEDSLADAESLLDDRVAPGAATGAAGIGSSKPARPLGAAAVADRDDGGDAVRTVGDALDRWRAGAYERALLQRVLADRLRQARAALQRLQAAQAAEAADAASTRARSSRADDALHSTSTKLPALAAAGASQRPASGPAALARARARPLAGSATDETADTAAAIAAARSAYEAAVDGVWALRERQYEEEDAAERAAAQAQSRAFGVLSDSGAAASAATPGGDAAGSVPTSLLPDAGAPFDCRGRDEVIDDNADHAALQRALALVAASASGTGSDDSVRAQVAAALSAAQEALTEAFAALRADLRRIDDDEWVTQVASALHDAGAAGKAYSQLVAATTASPASSAAELAAVDPVAATSMLSVVRAVASTDTVGWPAEAHRVFLHVFKADVALGTSATSGSTMPGTTSADVSRARMVLSLMRGLLPPTLTSRASTTDTDEEDPSLPDAAPAPTPPPTALQLCVDLISTPEVVLLHHRLHAARRMYRMRRTARREQWRRELSVAVKEAQASLAATAERATDEVAVANVRRAQQQRQRELHDRLQSQREEKGQQEAIAAAVAKELQEAELAVAEAKTAAQRAAAARKKAAIEAFRAEQAEMNSHAERIRAATAALIAEERAAEVAAGAVRVAKRYEEQAADRARRSDAIKAEAAALQAAREASLQSLLASVPYFARLEEIKTTADTARTTGHTAASREAAVMSQAYAAFLRDVHAGADHVRGATLHGGVDLAVAADLAGSAEAAATDATDGGASTTYAPGHAEALRRLAVIRATEQGQFARSGYEDKRITRDPRWRLNTALRDAGLEGSAYARKALQAVPASGRGAVAAQRNASSLSLAWGDGPR